MGDSKRQQFHLSLIKANYINKHLTDSLAVFLVLSGEIRIKINHQEYHLCKDDLILINPFDSYEVISHDKNIFLSLQVASRHIQSYFNNKELPRFECNSVKQSGELNLQFNKIRKILAHMMASYLKNHKADNLESYQYLFELLSYLSKEFSPKDSQITKHISEIKDEKLQRILRKIHLEYSQPITLDQLSDESGLSYYHLSRTFKKKIGLNFTEYLNQIRLSHATEDLLLSNDSIVEVALNNGFSNAKHFHQVFKKNHNVTPTNYRKTNSQTREKNELKNISDYVELENESAQQELSKYLVGKDIDDDNTAVEKKIIVDVSQQSNLSYKQAKKIIRLGKAKEGLDSAVQIELKLVQTELNFDYAYFEGFCKETHFEQNLTIISEYLLNNRLFDFLVSIKLTPMIELCIPKEAETFQEIECWCDYQVTLLRHFLNRYGITELESWSIVWGNPEGYSIWDERSSHGYCYFYRNIRNKIGDSQIGLLTLSELESTNTAQYERFVETLAKQVYLPNFLCYGADPYKSEKISEVYAKRFKEYQQLILAKVTSVIGRINELQSEESWQPNIYLTEWNTLVGVGDTLAGTFFRSALILESILEYSHSNDGLAYWLNIKVKERQTIKREDSSLSLFLYDNLRRPLFFLLSFLNRMAGEIIESGDNYIMTHSCEHYYLLVFNSNYLDPHFSVDSFEVSYQSKKMSIRLEQIPQGAYLVRHYILDKDHGGIYNDWLRVSGQEEIDGELQTYLEQVILPKFDLLKEKIEPTGYQIETLLTLNACQLYIFQPIY